MRKLKLTKRIVLPFICTAFTLSAGIFAYANAQALPNGTIQNQDGTNYLVSPDGTKYSGWFFDSNSDWYYFDESTNAMKTGWHLDGQDGYWYYLNPTDGKMLVGWQEINGKEYFFQPVRDMGNYNFSSEQEKWLYTLNAKVPYGAMYVNTTTPDGSTVNENGEKVTASSHMLKNGWVSENGSWYYYQNDMKFSNQWLSLNGVWYYLRSDGTMVSNSWYDVDGKSYYFGSDGAMYVNRTTPDGNTVDGSGAKIVQGSQIDLNRYIGVYDQWNATGPGYQMLITSISDNMISGAYVQVFDNANHEGRYAKFTAPLSNNRFTVAGDTVNLQMEAYEITGWSGVTGSFSAQFELAYIDGEAAIIDNDYNSSDEYSPYLRKVESLSGSAEESFWTLLYNKVSGESWKDKGNYSKWVGTYSGDYYAGVLWTGVMTISKYENGAIHGTYKSVRGDSTEQFDFSVSVNSDGYFKLPNGEEWFFTEKEDGTLAIVAWVGRDVWFSDPATMEGDGPRALYKE